MHHIAKMVSSLLLLFLIAQPACLYEAHVYDVLGQFFRSSIEHLNAGDFIRNKKGRDTLVCYFVAMSRFKLIMLNYHMRIAHSKCNKIMPL